MIIDYKLMQVKGFGRQGLLEKAGLSIYGFLYCYASSADQAVALYICTASLCRFFNRLLDRFCGLF